MPLVKNQLIPLSIGAISSDGNGIGRHDGQAVFVPATAVGDTVQVRITKVQKQYAYARPEEVLQPGPGRREEDCPVSRVCGGCNFRHLTYEAELCAKQGFVADALRRIGHLDVSPRPICPSPQEDRYRNKVQYPVAAGQNGELLTGFYAAHSHRVVPCQDCLLQPQLLNRIAARAAALLQGAGAAAYNEATQTGLVRHLYLRQSTQSGGVLLCFVLAGRALPGGGTVETALLQKFPEIETIVLNHNPKNTNVVLGRENRVLYGKGTLNDSLCSVPLKLGVHSFAQVNAAGAEKLFGFAAAFAAPQKHEVLLDLYCGTGVIGLSMAASAKRLIGVDIVPPAIESARESAQKMGLSNTNFLCADAAGAAARLAAQGEKPDVIVLDPPRKGAGAATLQAVLAMAPQRIVMVSCNPATLARDLAILATGGYAVDIVQPVDLFPRTKHVECVCLLTKHA
ncbi:23S rRNA (uracil(1939)-C(5))-methyltransferase RlmD [Ruminococcaceae bacterium OttesenSCG-928-O06]|nr:23S rRNA (uracil(1939)-C(5))-methyltransferase RlmD [Ruminococcaceae bacterium OttesenSCG-928-O06]